MARLQQILPLELLGAGEQGRVLDIDGDDELTTRLEEMGLHVGSEVRMIQPGCPCLVAVDNHRLSFRGDHAAVVLVEIYQSAALTGNRNH